MPVVARLAAVAGRLAHMVTAAATAAAPSAATAAVTAAVMGLGLAGVATPGCDGAKPGRPPPGLVDSPVHRPRRAPGAPAGRSPATPPPASDSRQSPPGAADVAAGAPAFAPVTGDGYTGYIQRALGEPNWTPSADDVAAMEARVPDAFAAAVARGDVPAGIDLSTYTRQYHGLVSDGHRVIRAVFVCERSRHLAARMFTAGGGSTCFVHTAYDTADHTFAGWRVNARR